MRDALHHDLSGELVAMSGLATAAMARAGEALARADLTLAERVIADDAELDRRSRRCEEHACRLLAQQAPVAGALRAVVAAIKAAEKIERMGDLARHVAELVRMRHPEPVLPADLVPYFARMGRLAVESGRHLENALGRRTGDCLTGQERVDDQVDELHRTVLTRIRRSELRYPVRTSVDAALLARYLERFADQAVGVAKQLDFAVTGRAPA
jgi:phosphate transport system protein